MKVNEVSAKSNQKPSLTMLNTGPQITKSAHNATLLTAVRLFQRFFFPNSQAAYNSVGCFLVLSEITPNTHLTLKMAQLAFSLFHKHW